MTPTYMKKRSKFTQVDRARGEGLRRGDHVLCPLHAGLPATVEDAIASHQTELQAWLNKFDQFLPRPQTCGGSSDVNESTIAECEAMWEVIKTDDVMMTSLAHIHTALMEWSNGLPFSGGNGFNPLGGCSDPPVMEIVDNIDWKGIQ